MQQMQNQTRPLRGVETLKRVTVVSRPIEETFAFFSDAFNLNRLTPSWVGFQILSKPPLEMRENALIDYSIRIRGVPVRWRTQILSWNPPHSFVDLQIKGPYQWWHHTHRFESCDQGTRVIDEVEYRAPLAWLSHPLMVTRDVERIFDYRETALQAILK